MGAIIHYLEAKFPDPPLIPADRKLRGKTIWFEEFADTIACGTSAGRLVLLGDPLQLAQVTQGVHPDGSGASALVHVLGGQETIPPGWVR